MKYIALTSICLSLIGCDSNLAKERKKNAPYLMEADRIVLGCEKYYIQHKKYPGKLDDLGTEFWTYAKIDIRKNSNIKVLYNGEFKGETGLSIKIGSIQYYYDFIKWQDGWRESDNSVKKSNKQRQ